MARKDVPDLLVCRVYREMWARRHANPGRSGRPWPEEMLATETGQPQKVCYRAMERAFEHGLLDYGMWLRGAWLTPAGLELLASAEAAA